MLRGFIALSVLLSVSLSALAQDKPKKEIEMPKIDNAALDKLGWKLGSQAYTFRSVSLMETLDILKQLGLKYVEIYPGQRFTKDNTTKFDHNATPEMIEQFQAKLKENGITAVNYGVVGLGADEKENRKVFDFAKKLGLINICSEPKEEDLPGIDKLAQEYGINVAIHNHPKPSHYWDPQLVKKACEGRSERIGACADDGHWYRSGLVPVEGYKVLEGRILVLHFKDIDTVNGKKQDVPWGTGKCDVPALLAEIKRQGIKPIFSIEYEHGSGDELVENVAKSVQFFSDTAARLAQ